MLPKIPVKEVRKFIKNKENEKLYPIIYLTLLTRLSTEDKDNKCYNIKW